MLLLLLAFEHSEWELDFIKWLFFFDLLISELLAILGDKTFLVIVYYARFN